MRKNALPTYYYLLKQNLTTEYRTLLRFNLNLFMLLTKITILLVKRENILSPEMR